MKQAAADGQRRCLPPAPPLSQPQRAQLDAFLELLLRWNSRINLVADRDVATIRRRHIDDSWQLLPLLPPGEAAIADMGSGGGFPGLVLAIGATRPIHLVEADRRKAAFLVDVAGHLRLAHVHVHPCRVERAPLPPLAAVTARALAPLHDLLTLAVPHLLPGGSAIFPKGRNVEAELTAARTAWTFDLERFASRTDPEATLLRLSNIVRGPHA